MVGWLLLNNIINNIVISKWLSPNPSVILCFPEEFKQISWPKKSVISSQTPLSCRYVQVWMTFGGILVFLELHWTYFTPFPSASIVDFEQVNASWVLTIFHFSRNSKTCVKIKRINHLLITLRLAKNVQQRWFFNTSMSLKLDPLLF